MISFLWIGQGIENQKLDIAAIAVAVNFRLASEIEVDEGSVFGDFIITLEFVS